MSNRNDPDYVLNAVRGFIETIMWAPDEYLDAATLMNTVSHVLDSFDTVPYMLVTSKDPKVGKSTLSKNIPLLLADRTWRVSRNTTTPALRDKWLERERPYVILLDDAGKIFGEAGTSGKTSPVYQLCIDGYERNATVSVSRNGLARDMPAFVQVFMNGLSNAVPDDLATRAVHFRLEPKPPEIVKKNALAAGTQAEAKVIKAELHKWATRNARRMENFMRGGVLRVHPLLTDRLLQIWGPLFAVADAAQGDWPQRCLDAFLLMALDESGDKPPVLAEDQCLLDTAKVIRKFGAAKIFTAELIRELRLLPEGRFYKETDDEYLAGDLLPRALGPALYLKGAALDGRPVTGKGRLAAPILKAADDLRAELTQKPGSRPLSAAARELELEDA